jgi:4-hydroxy-tetrahydrodipicolinate reductase
MKIVLIGYGKMGKAIETIALERGHQIGLKADSKTPLTMELLKQHDVAIEFTNPQACVGNIELCLQAGIPVVVGSTGWYGEFETVKTLVARYNGGLLHATNFSIGVNLFFGFNAYIAKVMGHYPQYNVKVHEVHHTQKLDAPSGTAITTAETIVKNNQTKQKWVHGSDSNRTDPQTAELEITHERIDNVPGTHVVNYTSEIDDITLTHTAHNRKGFASGAVTAAEWLKGKKGIFTMKDVLNIEY